MFILNRRSCWGPAPARRFPFPPVGQSQRKEALETAVRARQSRPVPISLPGGCRHCPFAASQMPGQSLPGSCHPYGSLRGPPSLVFNLLRVLLSFLCEKTPSTEGDLGGRSLFALHWRPPEKYPRAQARCSPLAGSWWLSLALTTPPCFRQRPCSSQGR